MDIAINPLENRVAERTQAAGLVRLVREFEEKGFEVRVSAKGELWGIRRAKTPESVFTHNELIKGMKAYYGKEYFRVVGGAIIERVSGRCVDIVVA